MSLNRLLQLVMAAGLRRDLNAAEITGTVELKEVVYHHLGILQQPADDCADN